MITMTNELQEIMPGMDGVRIGEDYEFLIYPNGTKEKAASLSLSQIKEVRGNLVATVEASWKEGEGKLLLFSDQVWMTSGKDLTRIEARLADSTGRLRVILDDNKRTKSGWEPYVEAACKVTREDVQGGAPEVSLTSVKVQPEVPFLLHPLLLEGKTTLLYGDGGSAKSLTAMFLAVAVATGHDLPGMVFHGAPARVIYLDWEADDQDAAMRMRLVEAGLGVKLEEGSIIHRYETRPLADNIRNIKSAVDRHHAGLVIVDSVAWASGGDINDSETAIRLLNAVRSLGHVTVLLIAHINKVEATSTGVPRVIGSGFWMNGPRTAWAVRLTQEEEEDVINLVLFHAKVNPTKKFKPFGIRYEFQSGQIAMTHIDPRAVPELSQHMGPSKQINARLEKGAVYPSVIADELAMTVGAVKKHLGRLKAQGEAIVVLEGKGRGNESLWGKPAREGEAPF